MPQLPNAMHERFAQARARGLDGTASAIEAGYAERSARVRACELNKRPDVAARIEELRAQVEKAVVREIAISREWVLQQLVANAQDARAANDRGAANRALELIGKEMGMFIDRKMDVKNPLDALSTQQLLALTQMLDQITEKPRGCSDELDLETAETINKLLA